MTGLSLPALSPHMFWRLRTDQGWLAKQENTVVGGPWLVGDKMSYADLAFIPWQHVMELALSDVYDQAQFPHLQKWYDSMTSRPAVKRVFEKAAQSGGH